MDERIPARIVYFASAAALISCFVLTSVWSVRTALSDYWFQQVTLAGTERAIRLEPDAAAYYARLAAIVQESNPVRSTQALQRAVALNPRDSQSWVNLGLRAEATGDLPGAERDLLAAARIDREYLPIWSLLNFYFRHGDKEKFWASAKPAVEIAYGDLAPLFALCWNMSGDGERIEQKLDIQDADKEASYLTYLTAQNRIEPMIRAAARLLAWNRDGSVPALLAACDRLIADDRVSPALQIWNRLAELRRIPSGVLHPEAGQSLSDGDLLSMPSSQGFAWRLPAPPGVTVSLQDRPPGLRINFLGRQPESCEVLAQYLPVIQDSPYELRYRYRTSDIAPGTGLAWRLTDLKGSRLLAQGDSLASENETEGRLAFRTSSADGLVRLALVYQRALGTTRIEGSITLSKLSVSRNR